MIRFGTGGWRAIIGDEFTKENVRILTSALARLMIDEGVADQGFVIGFDRRFLSREAAGWAAEVMAGEGVPCRFINKEAPTPLIMFEVKRSGTHYGMSVTASHNPAVYNGIKIFTEGGKDADGSVTARIESYIDSLDDKQIRSIPFEDAVTKGVVRFINPQNDYIDSVIHSVNMDAIKKRELKVVLDPMYGVSKTSLQTILLTARCDVSVIHDRHDTLFGGRLPSPNVDTLTALKNFVLESKADIGIATDGDADRLGIIDDKGGFVHPNQILVLLYYYLLEYKGWEGPAVRNLATTHLLDKVASGHGQMCYEVNVGFKHISSKMIETNALIGGESSGGLTVRGHIQGKDGIYAAALLVEMLAVTGRSLSEIYKDITDRYGDHVMVENDHRFRQERKEEIKRSLSEGGKLPGFPVEVDKISYHDGCKFYFKNGGWVVARFSGTEPLLRIFCEMESEAAASEICDILKEYLKL